MGAAAPVAPVLTEGLGQEWYQADVRISIRPEELECGYFLLCAARVYTRPSFRAGATGAAAPVNL